MYFCSMSKMRWWCNSIVSSRSSNLGSSMSALAYLSSFSWISFSILSSNPLSFSSVSYLISIFIYSSSGFWLRGVFTVFEGPEGGVMCPYTMFAWILTLLIVIYFLPSAEGTGVSSSPDVVLEFGVLPWWSGPATTVVAAAAPPTGASTIGCTSTP